MFKSGIRRALSSFGFQLVRVNLGFEPEELRIFDQVKEFTTTSLERISGVFNSVQYVAANKIKGDFVECGVWRGGSMMAAIHSLLKAGDTSRHVYLYDTFEGLTEPGENDVAFDGQTAQALLAPDRARSTEREKLNWCVASFEDVQQNIYSTGYPKDRIHLIKGKVEDTIPNIIPDQIAWLRLDTDWYDSTKHELNHLYPRLSENGVLIIDDYGHWQGARKAVDEYFAGHKLRPMLNRLDYTGRLMIKPSAIS